MIVKEPSFKFGIEEEYLVVDFETRQLQPAPQALLAAIEAACPGQISTELMRSQIEVNTRPTRSFAEARADLANLRNVVATTARQHGLAPIAASSHPIGGYRKQQTTQNERYSALARDLAGVGRRLLVSGMHVHVEIPDNELRIDLLNQARYFLPHLLALSTSSPFWEGEQTGLQSFRLAVFNGLPRTGLPGRLEGWEAYRTFADILTRSGVIDDLGKIWWDIRPSAKFPTLEMRITDMCTRIDDAIAIAALFVCLCRMFYRLRRNNQSWRLYPVLLLEENRWRAQRYGIRDRLFDFGRSELVPFPELLAELLEIIEEDAVYLNCRNETLAARAIMSNGTSADRQVEVWNAALHDGCDTDTALACVVDHLIAETIADLDAP